MKLFFDLHVDGSVWPDRDGDDMADLAEARTMAAALVADLVRSHMADGTHRIFACEVKNSSGAVIHRAELEFRAYRPQPTVTVVGGGG